MTEKNNREGAKKKEELMISTLLLHQLGFEPDDKMSSEEPDIIVPPVRLFRCSIKPLCRKSHNPGNADRDLSLYFR